MDKSIRWSLLLAASLSLSNPPLAHAQTDTLETTTYGYADRLPELPGGGGMQAMKATILANFQFPADAPWAQQVGAFGLYAIVSTKGQVAYVRADDTARIKPSIAAAVAAVRQLPRLKPALLHEQPVQFSFTMRVTLTGQADSPRLEIDEHLTSPPDLAELVGEGGSPPVELFRGEQLYTQAEQMPALPTGSSLQAISEAIRQRLVLPRHLVEGIVFVNFVVTKDGDLAEPAISKGANADADAAVLAALRKLPRFTPGKQNNRPVNLKLSIRVPVVLPKAPAQQRDPLPTRKLRK